MIYCNVTECDFNEQLAEKQKRDSKIPNDFYYGQCVAERLQFVRNRFEGVKGTVREEAICNTFRENGNPHGWHDEIAELDCAMEPCFYNEQGECTVEPSNRHTKHVYVDWREVYNADKKERLPACQSVMNRRFKDRLDLGSYPKR